MAATFANTPGAIHDAQADVVLRNDFVHRRDVAFLHVRHERRHADLSAVLQIERCIGHIAEHGARGGIFAGAATVEHCVADNIAADEHRVEHLVHFGEHVRTRNERRIN